MHVNSGKHLRILLRALGFKLDGDVCDRLAALLKDMNHIVPRTASQSDQHQLHGTWSRTASLRPESRSKHDLVPAPGLADERAVFNPFDPCLHRRQPSGRSPERDQQYQPTIGASGRKLASSNVYKRKGRTPTWISRT